MLAKLTQQVRRWVDRLLVVEKPALGRAHRVQHGIRCRQTANSKLIADTCGLAKPTAGVAGGGVIEHCRVKLTHLLLKPGLDRRRVAELGPDVAEVDPADISDPLAARRFGDAKRLHEPAYVGISDRVDPLFHQIVKRPDQDRHDRELTPASQNVLEEDDLKLDRMLRSVRELVVEEIAAGQ